MKRYLATDQVSILRRLIHQHCANKEAYKDERLLGNKWHCCGGGYQLIQALYCKVNGKIGKYDAFCFENKHSELWVFLNDIYDKIASHYCSGHGHKHDHKSMIEPISIPIPILPQTTNGYNKHLHQQRQRRKYQNNKHNNHHKFNSNHRRRFHHYSNQNNASDGHGMDLMMFCEVGTNEITPMINMNKRAPVPHVPVPVPFPDPSPALPPPPVPVNAGMLNNPYIQHPPQPTHIVPGLQPGHAMLTNGTDNRHYLPSTTCSSGGNLVFNSGNEYIMYPMSSVGMMTTSIPNNNMSMNMSLGSVPPTPMSHHAANINMMNMPNLNITNNHYSINNNNQYFNNYG